MGVPVAVDWWVSLRRVPPKEAMVALFSKEAMLLAGCVVGEDVVVVVGEVEEDEAGGGEEVKCRAICDSLEAMDEVVWEF